MFNLTHEYDTMMQAHGCQPAPPDVIAAMPRWEFAAWLLSLTGVVLGVLTLLHIATGGVL